MPSEDDLRDLERKVKQLKLDYDRYFLGSRPREPAVLRADVDKLIAMYSNVAIQNTSVRFRFASLCSRYQALKRQWTEVQRKVEDGTYQPHRFKADLHERERADGGPPSAEEAQGAEEPDLFTQYRDARLACGQPVKNLTPEKLEEILEGQRAALRERFGDARFRFRVVVEDGKAKLKASRAGP